MMVTLSPGHAHSACRPVQLVCMCVNQELGDWWRPLTDHPRWDSRVTSGSWLVWGLPSPALLLWYLQSCAPLANYTSPHFLSCNKGPDPLSPHQPTQGRLNQRAGEPLAQICGDGSPRALLLRVTGLAPRYWTLFSDLVANQRFLKMGYFTMKLRFLAPQTHLARAKTYPVSLGQVCMLHRASGPVVPHWPLQFPSAVSWSEGMCEPPEESPAQGQGGVSSSSSVSK